MRKKALSFLILFMVFMTTIVKADCTNQYKPDDDKFKYFVGIGYDKSKDKAFSKAEQDVSSQFGRLFGVEIDTQTGFYATENISSAVSTTKEKTIGKIRLQGLERLDTSVQKDKNLYTAYVCYRYSKKEYEKEKNRLANLKPSDESNNGVVFNEQMGDSKCIGSPVSISTNPEGSSVIIDNGRYQGETPVKFANICNGKHEMIIIKDDYEMVKESFIVPNNGSIHKNLVRDTKEVKISTTFGDSRILINGLDYGREPVNFKAMVGVPYEIQVNNNKSQPVKVTKVFHTEENNEYKITLAVKRSFRIDFSAFRRLNPDVAIFINGKEVVGNRSKLLNESPLSLTFSKDGFIDKEEMFELSSNDEIEYYKAEKLQFIKETEGSGEMRKQRRKKKINSQYDNNKRLGFMIGYNSANDGGKGYALNMFYDKKYYMWYFGLYGGYSSSEIGLKATEYFHTALDYYGNNWGYHYVMTDDDAYFNIESFFQASVGINLNRYLTTFLLVEYGNAMLELGPAQIENKETMFFYGLGLQYYVTDMIALRLTYKIGKIPEKTYSLYKAIISNEGIKSDNGRVHDKLVSDKVISQTVNQISLSISYGF